MEILDVIKNQKKIIKNEKYFIFPDDTISVVSRKIESIFKISSKYLLIFNSKNKCITHKYTTKKFTINIIDIKSKKNITTLDTYIDLRNDIMSNIDSIRFISLLDIDFYNHNPQLIFNKFVKYYWDKITFNEFNNLLLGIVISPIQYLFDIDMTIHYIRQSIDNVSKYMVVEKARKIQTSIKYEFIPNIDMMYIFDQFIVGKKFNIIQYNTGNHIHIKKYNPIHIAEKIIHPNINSIKIGNDISIENNILTTNTESIVKFINWKLKKKLIVHRYVYGIELINNSQFILKYFIKYLSSIPTTLIENVTQYSSHTYLNCTYTRGNTIVTFNINTNNLTSIFIKLDNVISTHINYIIEFINKVIYNYIITYGLHPNIISKKIVSIKRNLSIIDPVLYSSTYKKIEGYGLYSRKISKFKQPIAFIKDSPIIPHVIKKLKNEKKKFSIFEYINFTYPNLKTIYICYHKNAHYIRLMNPKLHPDGYCMVVCGSKKYNKSVWYDDCMSGKSLKYKNYIYRKSTNIWYIRSELSDLLSPGKLALLPPNIEKIINKKKYEIYKNVLKKNTSHYMLYGSNNTYNLVETILSIPTLPSNIKKKIHDIDDNFTLTNILQKLGYILIIINIKNNNIRFNHIYDINYYNHCIKTKKSIYILNFTTYIDNIKRETYTHIIHLSRFKKHKIKYVFDKSDHISQNISNIYNKIINVKKHNLYHINIEYLNKHNIKYMQIYLKNNIVDKVLIIINNKYVTFPIISTLLNPLIPNIMIYDYAKKYSSPYGSITDIRDIIKYHDDIKIEKYVKDISDKIFGIILTNGFFVRIKGLVNNILNCTYIYFDDKKSTKLSKKINMKVYEYEMYWVLIYHILKYIDNHNIISDYVNNNWKNIFYKYWTSKMNKFFISDYNALINKQYDKIIFFKKYKRNLIKIIYGDFSKKIKVQKLINELTKIISKFIIIDDNNNQNISSTVYRNICGGYNDKYTITNQCRGKKLLISSKLYTLYAKLYAYELIYNESRRVEFINSSISNKIVNNQFSEYPQTSIYTKTVSI